MKKYKIKTADVVVEGMALDQCINFLHKQGIDPTETVEVWDGEYHVYHGVGSGRYVAAVIKEM